MKRILKSNRGEGSLGTGVKIIIAVVIGALVLGGLFALWKTVLLPKDTVKLLIEEHERHPANPYLFPSPRTGEMWDPDGFRRLHERIIKEIGAEHVRFHDMRHTFATL